GVALALLLILVLDAIFTGTERQLTAYIDYSGADVFVSQAGVYNMHMASSSLSLTTVQEVKDMPEVASVTPILYLANMVVIGPERSLAYIIGLPQDAYMGVPWRISTGYAFPGPGEAIIDSSVAARSGVGIGDRAKILGEEFEITGLSEGTASLVNSLAFIALDDFTRLRGNQQLVSFLLVKVKPGATPDAVTKRIEMRVPGVTAQTREAFAAQERKVVRDMSTDVITIMNTVGFMIGLAVLALTVYTATLSRRGEYGVLKALGARSGDLYHAVMAQAVYSVSLGFAIGLALTLLLSAIVPRLGFNLVLEVSSRSLLKVSSMSLAIAIFSAVLPIKQIAGLDPVVVFRRK
ncbi:MAG: ABC transporter permease, partial [Chloroflexi bacterium]|nr:ABC transporter permease [Chloroflexota bacterium]